MSEKRLKHPTAALVIALSLVLLVVAGWIGDFLYQNWDRMELASQASVSVAAIGALATFMLAAITIFTVLQNQENLQEQRRQLERQEDRHRPILRQVGKFSGSDEEEDVIHIGLENVGKDIAMDIKARPILFLWTPTGAKTVSSYFQAEKDLPELEPREWALNKKGSDTMITNRGGFLNSGQKDTFSQRVDHLNKNVSPDVTKRDGDNDYPRIIRFIRMMDILRSREIESAALSYFITYEDIHGNSQTETLTGVRFDIEDVDSIENIIGNILWYPEIGAETGSGLQIVQT